MILQELLRGIETSWASCVSHVRGQVQRHQLRVVRLLGQLSLRYRGRIERLQPFDRVRILTHLAVLLPALSHVLLL
jgi:hypothetical protein